MQVKMFLYFFFQCFYCVNVTLELTASHIIDFSLMDNFKWYFQAVNNFISMCSKPSVKRHALTNFTRHPIVPQG